MSHVMEGRAAARPAAEAPDRGVPARLVSIPTPTDPLDGLFYEPPGGASRGAVLLMHGNQMNFYVGPSRFLPPVLVEAGYACLAFNRRGHDILVTPRDRGAGGGAFQLIDEAREDNRLAAAWLGARGFSAPIVVGHSNGGMLAVRHVADHPETPALVLLSAHKGGPDLLRDISRVGLFAHDRLEAFKSQARRLVAEGEGDALIQIPGWWYVVSARSLLDYAERCPDVLALAPEIRCPVLYVRGDKELADIYPAERFAALQGRTDVAILPDCDHFYTRREAAVTGLVPGWIDAALERAR